jgi:hypothetical protein
MLVEAAEGAADGGPPSGAGGPSAPNAAMAATALPPIAAHTAAARRQDLM